MTAQSPSGFRSVFRVVSGNFLEMYDFMVWAYYAGHIGKAFFPPSSEFASLMYAFMTFGVGYLMRPLGAIFLGAYIDNKGRRKGLMLTLGLMATGTVLIAFVPGYAAIGLSAPLLVLIGRLIQGFSAGAELGGVSVYLSEIAKPGKKGFYVSWQSGSQQVAVIFTGLIGVVLGHTLVPSTLSEWGWRVPFFIGCLIVPFIFVIRRSLQETEDFKGRSHHPKAAEIFTSMIKNWGLVARAAFMVVMTTVSFYLITAYTPTFGKSVLHLSETDAFLVTIAVGLSNLFWLPVMGSLSDRIGRKPILLFFTAIAVLTVYPAISWLVAEPSFGRLLGVELWLSFLYGSYNGAMVVALTEIMPPEVRTTGFSMAYSLATAIFGGFTPAVSTYLIQATGNKAAPGIWMSCAALCSLLATLSLFKRTSSVKP